MSSLPARIRALDPWRFDVALGLFVSGVGTIEALLAIGPHTRILVPLAGLLLLPIPLAFRRRNTPAALAGFFAIVTAMSALSAVGDDLGTPFLMVLVLAFTIGVDTEGRATLLSLAIFIAGLFAYLAVSPSTDPSDYAFVILVGTLPPFIAGRMARSRNAAVAELRRKKEVLEGELEERERTAVHSERARIARELHDVVAHSLSVMVVQAGAARAVIDRDRALAGQAFGAIEDAGRDALGEMRRLLGMLREDGEEPAVGPQPSLDELGAMVERARSAGLEVDLAVTGSPRPYTSGFQLAAYRIVQEALTNTFKHSGSRRARVEISHSPRGLGLVIADEGHGSPVPGLSREGGGNGLRGMRERVGLYGGTFEAGPGEDGGFVVRAWLEAPADPAAPAAPAAEAAPA